MYRVFMYSSYSNRWYGAFFDGAAWFNAQNVAQVMSQLRQRWAVSAGFSTVTAWAIVDCHNRLLANSAYAPAGELMAALRGEQEAA